MKTTAGAIILFISLTACSACATGANGNVDKTVTTHNITVPDFQKIDVSSGIQVIYSQGELSQARVKAPRYMLDYLEIGVKKGTLDVGISSSYWRKFHSFNGDITVTVSSPSINDLEASSGASIKVNGALNAAGAAEIETSSGASISIPGGFKSNGKVELDTGSGSSISITGLNAPRIDADLSSGSSMQLTNVSSTQAVFDLSSGASCTVTGRTANLNVEASSGSSFHGSKFLARTADIEAASGAGVDYNAEKANVDAGITCSVKNHR